MKNYSYTFSIDKPCSENWQNMSASEKGKFCLSCQKEVIDFSKLSDQEIIRVIESASGGVCGRFKNTQLNRPVFDSYYLSPSSPSLRTILAGIVFLSVVIPAQVKADIDLPVRKSETLAPFHAQNKIFSDTSAHTYKGKVVLNDSIAAVVSMSDFTVQLKGSTYLAVPDSSGNFELLIHDSISNEKYSIYIVFSDLVQKEYQVDGIKTDYTQRHSLEFTIEQTPVSVDPVNVVTVGSVVYTKDKIKKGKKKKH